MTRSARLLDTHHCCCCFFHPWIPCIVINSTTSRIYTIDQNKDYADCSWKSRVAWPLHLFIRFFFRFASPWHRVFVHRIRCYCVSSYIWKFVFHGSVACQLYWKKYTYRRIVRDGSDLQHMPSQTARRIGIVFACNFFYNYFCCRFYLLYIYIFLLLFCNCFFTNFVSLFFTMLLLPFAAAIDDADVCAVCIV